MLSYVNSWTFFTWFFKEEVNHNVGAPCTCFYVISIRPGMEAWAWFKSDQQVFFSVILWAIIAKECSRTFYGDLNFWVTL